MGKMSKVAAGVLCGVLLLTGCAGSGNNTPVVQGGASTVEGTPMTTPSPEKTPFAECVNESEGEYKNERHYNDMSYDNVEHIVNKEEFPIKISMSSKFSCSYKIIPELKKNRLAV